MARYSQITNQEKQELLSDFCEALAVLKTADEAMKFLTDLLGRQEIIALAKRIKIAKLLLASKDYREIARLLKVSHATIAKVSQWLMESGEGFKLVAERTKDKKRKQITGSAELRKIEWDNFKKGHPLMFWPELLIKDVIKTMDRKQKDKIKAALAKIDYKSSLYRRINRLLK
ncbi:MAG: YerC/YecD family TrpR-related protein [bacterium]|nr:YerC/YecD family TrpR-related protein [bacterium]